MAHNLNLNEKTGQYSFFTTQQKAWHGLGKVVENYPNSKEAIQFAGLDYTVEKRPLFTYDSTNDHADPDTDIIIPEVEVPNYFATIRNDTDQVLGVVGKDYEIVQNIDAFSFFDSIVNGDGIQYETAGALGNGERIFITAKLPNYIRVAGEDLIEQYLFLTTSHDGFGSITAAFTPVRIVCNNTLNAALRNHSNAVKIRHTVNAKERLAQAHQLMGITNKLSEELETIFNKWATVYITDPQVKQLIQRAMVPNKETLQSLISGRQEELSTNFNNTVDQVYAYAMTCPNQLQASTRGTVFGAYNAIAGYFQNLRPYKSGEAKLKSIMYGGTAQSRAQAAFNLCTDFANIGQEVLLLN